MSNSEEIKNHRDKIASEGFSKLYPNPIIPYDIHPEVINNIEAKLISNQVHEEIVEKRKINRIGIVGHGGHYGMGLAAHIGKFEHSTFAQSTINLGNEKPCVVVVGGDNGIGVMHAIEMARKIGADVGTIIVDLNDNSQHLQSFDPILADRITEDGRTHIAELLTKNVHLADFGVTELANQDMRDLIAAMEIIPLKKESIAQKYGKIILASDDNDDLMEEYLRAGEELKHRGVMDLDMEKYKLPPLPYLEPRYNGGLDYALLDVMDSRNYSGGTPNKQILEASKLDYERLQTLKPKDTNVFNFPDGFSCNARNQKNADRKHKNYLKDKN